MSISDQLKQRLKHLQDKRRVQNHLNKINEQLSKDYQKLEKLYKQLQKEFNDVEQLEKLSMKGLFHNVLGNKEQQLEKERQEYLQISLKYNEAKKSIDLLEYEKKVLEDQLPDSLVSLQKEVNQLMKIRESELIRQMGQRGNRLLAILKKMEILVEQDQHIAGIQANGGRILHLLDSMEKQLRLAQNWGQWDMMGDQNSNHYKSRSIDKSRDLAYHVQHLINRYKADLELLFGGDQGIFGLDLQLEGFNRFTDVFFDNLISDWIIQQKIKNAAANVSAIHDRVVRIQKSLDAEKMSIHSETEALNAERNAILLS